MAQAALGFERERIVSGMRRTPENSETRKQEQ
jgi:hypothetical protein